MALTGETKVIRDFIEIQRSTRLFKCAQHRGAVGHSVLVCALALLAPRRWGQAKILSRV